VSLQFADVAAAALEMAPVLLAQWIGGKRQGHEWVGERKANGGLGDSWAVNLNTGQWLHGAGDEVGGDLVSLHAAINHLDQLAALKIVASMVGIIDGPAPKILPRVRPEKAPESKPEPIPEDAPPIPPHPEHGAASAVYAYGSAFVVARYDLAANEKQFRPFTWRAGRWHAKGYPEPRPLYGAAQLAAQPQAPVLVVEGEKCADIAALTLKKYVCLTWSGGAQAVKKTDWAPLAGRDVIIWPDADEPGAQAAANVAERIAGIAERVRVIQPNGQTDGWDIADAVAEGWDAKTIAKWASEHIRVVTATMSEPTPVAAPKDAAESSDFRPEGSEVATTEPATSEPSAMVVWQHLPLDKNDKGVPHATLANASVVFQLHEAFRGKIWLDSFRGRIYHTLHGPAPRAWTDLESRQVTAWMQQNLHLPKMTLSLVQDAVMHAAECNQRNSLIEWLDSLEWDGVPRLDDWLADTLEVERSEYTTAVARNWPISMVARAFVPGCQVDHMTVLEGHMGRGKSKFLEILGGEWYKALPMAFGDKDFLQAIQGAWLIEIPDMTGFSRREHSHVLATITIRTDEYRKSYGRFSEAYPRVAVFAATSETDDYLQDTRGRRRYWPLRCGHINLDSLYAQRSQIFAEAVCIYRQGATWHVMPDSTDDEQLDRNAPDLWTDLINGFVERISGETSLIGSRDITSTRILEQAIGILPAKQGDIEKKRISRIMRDLGWVPMRTKDQRYWKKVERRD
jgi:putative DNA primase/helicase